MKFPLFLWTEDMLLMLGNRIKEKSKHAFSLTEAKMQLIIREKTERRNIPAYDERVKRRILRADKCLAVY